MSVLPMPYQVRTASELLGLVPFLLGHHPSDSIVAVFVDADDRVQGACRVDLDFPTDLVLSQVVSVATHRGFDKVVIVGYGPQSGRPAVRLFADVVAEHIPSVQTFLLADGQRFCLDRGCDCPATAGVAFDPKATVIAAQLSAQGMVALPSRDDLLDLLAPDAAAQAQVTAAITELTPRSSFDKAALHALMDLARDAHRLTDEQAARLATALEHRTIRDDAWLATSTDMWQRDLWLDITRRVPNRFVTAPASLAAWCAWQRGEEALAMAAARLALSVTPDYQMARLIVAGMQLRLPARDLLRQWPDLVATSELSRDA